MLFRVALVLLIVCSFLCGKAQTSILFCGGIENEMPVGVSDRFYPDSAGTFLYAHYASRSPLETRKVAVELLKQTGNTFEQIGERQTYTVKPKWKATYMKCYFPGPGLYKVRMYDAADKLMGEGLITIM